MTNPFEELAAQLNRIEEMMRQILSQQQQTTSALVDDASPLNLEQAAELLGLAPGTVYQNIKAIPHDKRHGRLYFYRPQLLEYLKTGHQVDLSSVLHSTRKKQKGTKVA